MTFWTHATQSQRLAQIDGGIELGMSAKTIAINVRAPRTQDVSDFGKYHGRTFPNRSSRDQAKSGRAGGVALRRKRGIAEIFAAGAFTIFEEA